jgi:hypothetical protein
MKKVMSLFLIAVLISGCNRMIDNVSPASQSSKAPAPVPKSQNAPASELQPSPTPAPIVHANPDLDPVEELCDNENFFDLYYSHAVLSFGVNSVLLLLADCCPSLYYFFTIIRMCSVFSFPVHVYLTNPSFLSKSKVSLFLLAVDTCLSLCRLNRGVVLAQTIFETVRFVAYPHIASFLL